ncbi:MAG TPA: ATP-grasp domain-containing protein [Ktedonobacteraceae bacterium]|nr:ATP-grasp domain-containing protein [Ktedonobacteraceae bacterium]
MRIIFCSDYWNRLAPDPLYQAEAKAAQKLHLDYSLINFEALTEKHNAEWAVSKVEPATDAEVAIYRGWMLKPHVYEHLYAALAEKKLLLINTPVAYKHCHYLPESYHIIEGYTPRSLWLTVEAGVDMDSLMQQLRIFGDKPVIVKDFVKSRKHEWHEACYIPSASDKNAVEQVVTRFLQLQGEDLNEGLVFREFIEFAPLTLHSRSGMPLTKEFRLFVLDGQIIVSAEYWEEGNYDNDQKAAPPLDLFRQIAQKIQSRFFTLDVAMQRDGTWSIVETGDAQVAGLPEKIDVEAFYQALAAL